MPESTPNVLPYRGRSGPREPLPSFYRTDAFRWVRFCWAMPLGIGVAVFIAFVICDRLGLKSLSMAVAMGGLLTVLIGLLATLCGCIIILSSGASRWSRSGARWDEVFAPALVSVAILLSNFVAAYILACIAFLGGFGD